MCAGLCKALYQSGLTAGFRKLAIIASVDGRRHRSEQTDCAHAHHGQMAHVEGAACGPQTISEVPNLVSWQASEQLCECMWRQKWPDLEVLNIPNAQEMRMRVERADVAMCYNRMF